MSRRIVYIIISVLFGLILFPFTSTGQFREEAFTQTYNEKEDTTGRDSTDKAFTFREFFGGVSHKRDARIGVMFTGSTVFIGAQQMHNKQYWKLPVVYGGLAATAGLGAYFRHKYNTGGEDRFKTASTLCFAGTGLFYWGSLLDGAVNYDKGGRYPNPGKATIYAILLPGLGQAYNKEYWKIPIYYTGLMVSTHLLISYNTNYKRYKRIYNEASAENSTYDGPVSASTAKYYRDVYRRYRDYSIVALLGFYVLQVIDANVFSYMHDFEITDDLSLNISPAIISPDNFYASSASGYGGGRSRMGLSGSGKDAFGLSVGFRF